MLFLNSLFDSFLQWSDLNDVFDCFDDAIFEGYDNNAGRV